MAIKLVGNETQDGNRWTPVVDDTYCVKFTADYTGVLNQIGIYIGNETAGFFKAALFSDSSGPSTRLTYQNTGVECTGFSWNYITVPDYLIYSGTSYWLVFVTTHSGTFEIFENSGITPFDHERDTSTTYAGGIPASLSSLATTDYGSMIAGFGVREEDAGSITGSGTFSQQNIRWHKLVGGITGSGALSGLTGQLFREFREPSNPRNHATWAERQRGCIFADNFVSDSMVRINAGSLTGSPTVNRRATFDGSNKIIYPAVSTSDTFSVVTRAKMTAAGPIIGSASLHGGTPADGFEIWADASGIYATHSAGASIATQCDVTGSFLDGNWHTVTYTVDLGTDEHILYVDDETADDQATTQAGPIGAASLINIGGVGTNYMTGSVHGVRIYNTVLTEEEHAAYASQI